MTGSYVAITPAEGRGEFRGYLALPAGGRGPGLVLLQEIFGINAYLKRMAEFFAEEGYVAVVPDLFWRLEPGVALEYSEADVARAMELYQRFDVDKAIEDVGATIAMLHDLPAVTGAVGAVGYCLGGSLAFLTAARTDVACAVGYYPVAVEQYLGEATRIACPLTLHFAELDEYAPPSAVEATRGALRGHGDVSLYTYPGVNHAFATDGRASYDKPSAMVAYSRTLATLRKALGPEFDLSELWDAHCKYEFVERDVPRTMATMVAEPYVNHIPTMTGGVGSSELSRFYLNHFVDANPDDTRLIPISRTVGTDRLVDEMLFCFTHDKEIDWMLPGIPPTGKYVEIPLVAIVNFRGDKLSHEHIYWDQASVLVQIGHLQSSGLPIAGGVTARKLIDETLPSNSLMDAWKRSEPHAAL